MNHLNNIIGCVLIFVASANAGGWRSTCAATQTEGSRYMWTSCANYYGQGTISVLDLNKCLMNRCGNLATGATGYDSTCEACDFNGVSAIFHCTCTDCSGKQHYTEIDTNNFITNQNGVLVC